MLQTLYGDEALSRSMYLNGLNDLKTGVMIFRMIWEAGVLQPLEMKMQSQISVKWWHEIVSCLSEWCRMN
jgi:hypothetical protein